MTTTNCNCRINCTDKAIIASAAIGIFAAFLRYSAIITVTSAFLWVLFGIAIGYLGLTLLTSTCVCCGKNNCCQNLGIFLAGILGTVLTSVILLGVTFAATSIIGAIITGALLFFFSLLVASAVCLIKCRYSCE